MLEIQRYGVCRKTHITAMIAITLLLISLVKTIVHKMMRVDDGK